MTDLRARWENGEIGLLNIGVFMTEEERTAAFEEETKGYCSQNDQDCKTCSLVNYGRDCHNREVNVKRIS
jgi:hypothetical protein